MDNLFLAGRIISASHVAFGSTRVMTTSAHSAQAVAVAAAICLQENLSPKEIYSKGWINELQKRLLRIGQYIPGVTVYDKENLVNEANLYASSEFAFNGFSADGDLKILDESMAQMIPLHKGEKLGKVEVLLEAAADTELEVELRVSSKPFNHTPDSILEHKIYSLQAGKQSLTIDFETPVDNTQYAFLVFKQNLHVQLQYSKERITGVLSVFNTVNKAVSNYGKQVPTSDIGIEEFEFWCPKRRPAGHNLAIHLEQSLHPFSVSNIKNGMKRPVQSPNAWVADRKDPNPTLTLQWGEVKSIGELVLFFDTDYDHPMETVQMTHPECRMPFCVEKYKVYDGNHNLLYEKTDNYQTIDRVKFKQKILTDRLVITLEHPSSLVPASLFAVDCYE